MRGTSASRSSLHTTTTPYIRPSYLEHSSFRHLLQEETSRGRTGDHSTIIEPVQSGASGGGRRRTHTPSDDSDEDEGSSNAPEDYEASTSPVPAESPVLILPTRWGETFRHHVLSVSQDGRDISFQGPSNASSEKKEAAAARTNYPVPAACGIYFFEVEILAKGPANKGHISIGFSGPEVRLNRLPGWEKHSWGYHTDTGCCCATEKDGSPFGPVCRMGDIIGCGIDFSQRKAFYTKNGSFLGYVFQGIGSECDLYPSVGLRYPGESIRANFGHEPFKFDIDYMVQQQRHSVWDRILHTPTNHDALTTVHGLAGDSPAINPSSTPAPDAQLAFEQTFKAPLHKLVLSYLIHHGHAKTTRALQAQSRNTDATSPWTIDSSSSTDADMDATSPPLPDDIDVRNSAVDAVIKGDIDTALQQTQTHFPSLLLDDDGLVLFKLKCRKFIELILGTAELKKRMDALLAAERASVVTGSAAGVILTEGDGDGDDGLMDDMDVDEDSTSPSPIPPSAKSSNGLSVPNGNGSERPRRVSSARRPHSSVSNEAVTAYEVALTQALTYGQLLQKDYGKDPREEVKMLFKRTFSIVAYHDPISAGPDTLAIVGQEARASFANELNQAILKSQGRPAQPPLETLYRRAAASLLQLGLLGEGAAAFADIQKELLDT